jgi:predicted nucleotidyltransferase
MNLAKILEIIKELNNKLKAGYPDFKGVYLYGSVAKGNFSEDSDIDIVALFEEINYEKELEIYGITGDLEYKYNVFFDIQPMTSQELEKNPFYFEEVTQKGMFYAV